MKCIVTAGPTYEELDEVRRLTNFSTGKLGSLLANFLVEKGHSVTLLYGHYSTHQGEQKAHELHKFTTTANLRDRLLSLSKQRVDAIFHAAAVSDFGFGKVFSQNAAGELTELREQKISTRSGSLLAELVPTPKIISELRPHFPETQIVGWKYEVDGDRPAVLQKAGQQIRENQTDACVANGPAYGFGFGLVDAKSAHQHFSDTNLLFSALEEIVRR
ncbi:MAG: DNA/pantothenate metabolism flavoprotein domain protein [Verrucomicrobia bacterium]|nr:DNA/pantothenate metabolism flavoprotein domain protein [Verrucomicrobiota bacterium]